MGGFVKKTVGKVAGFAGDILGEVTGANAAADAAKKAAGDQTRLGNQALDRVDAQQALFREDLTPFREELGLNLLPQVAELYGPEAGMQLLQSPIFQALADDATRRTLAAQASVGRAGAGETGPLLQDQLIRTGFDLLSRERGDLLNAIQFGQNAATQTGVSGNVNTADANDLLTQIANVNAAARIAEGNKRRSVFNDALQVGSLALGASGGGGGGVSGGGPGIPFRGFG